MALPTLSPGDLPIVFYAGECALCHYFVRRLFTHDQGRRLRYAPLAGKTARMLIGDADTIRERYGDTVLYLDAVGLAHRSTAALRILQRAGGMWRLVAWGGWLIPRGWRDWGYDRIARRRHLSTTSPTQCELPANAPPGIFLP